MPRCYPSTTAKVFNATRVNALTLKIHPTYKASNMATTKPKLPQILGPCEADAGTQGLPTRLFWARCRADKTLREVGAMASRSYSVLWRAENGQAVLDVATVEALATALNVRSAWLAFGDGQP